MGKSNAKTIGALAGSAGLLLAMGYFTLGRTAPSGTAAGLDRQTVGRSSAFGWRRLTPR